MAWKFEDNSIKVMEALDRVGKQWLDDASRVLLNQTIQNSRVDTGQTKGSWKRVVEDERAVVGSTSENAIWEEFGTGHYAINKDGRKTPWYVPVDGYLGKKKPTFNGKVVIVYGKGGKAYYKTNGKKPVRPLHNAKISTEKKIQKRLEQLVKENLS